MDFFLEKQNIENVMEEFYKKFSLEIFSNSYKFFINFLKICM